MSESWIWIIVGAAVAGCLAAIILWQRSRPKKHKTTLGRVAEFWNKPECLHLGPRGTRILVEPGAEISPAIIDAIEDGLADAFRRAACRGYRHQLDHRDHNVAVLVSTENDSLGFPAYRLPCAQYCGTEYDKGGYILVAGEMISVGNPHGNWIAIPEHPAHQSEHAKLISDFETEHPVLAWNHGEEFERTKTHSGGEGHPVIPDCPGTARFLKVMEIPLRSFGDEDGCKLLTK